MVKLQTDLSYPSKTPGRAARTQQARSDALDWTCRQPCLYELRSRSRQVIVVHGRYFTGVTTSIHLKESLSAWVVELRSVLHYIEIAVSTRYIEQ